MKRQMNGPWRSQLAVALLLLAALSWACRVGRDEGEADGRGGTVVIASQTTPDVLNPLLSSSSVSLQINAVVFDGLTRLNRDLSAAPNLAERWEISDDGRAYTFYLRKGVRFHDGAECTAEDVKFTYDIARQSAYGAPSYRNAHIERIETVDRYTVRITLDRIIPRFLTFSAASPIVPKHLLENGELHTHPFNRHPVGTGPFRFEGWSADSTRLALVANTHYFKGRPHLDRVVFWTGLDQSEQWVRLMRREIDVISSLTPEDMAYVRVDSTTFNLYSALQPYYHMLVYNLKNPRFADRRVRLALSCALDRQAIVDRALRGYGVLTSGPFLPNSWAYDPEILPAPYDPLRALRLLSEAGWVDRDGDGVLDKDGQPFEVSLLIDTGDLVKETAALVVRQNLQEIGVRLRLERLDANTLQKQRLPSGRFDMVLIQYVTGQDPDTADIFWHSKNIGRFNFARYRNAQVDRLLDAGNATTDREARRRIYRQVHAILAEDQPAAFLFYKHWFEAVNRRVAGVESGWGYNIYLSVPQWRVVPPS